MIRIGVLVEDKLKISTQTTLSMKIDSHETIIGVAVQQDHWPGPSKPFEMTIAYTDNGSQLDVDGGKLFKVPLRHEIQQIYFDQPVEAQEVTITFMASSIKTGYTSTDVATDYNVNAGLIIENGVWNSYDNASDILINTGRQFDNQEYDEFFFTRGNFERWAVMNAAEWSY